MRRWPCLIAIALTAIPGAFLAAGSGEDDRGLWWVRKHLEIIRDQLAGLRQHLRMYKASHGRYPTNDEGLAALDNFEARFVADFYREADASPDRPRSMYCGDLPRLWWRASRELVARYRREQGHVPTDAAELWKAGLGPRGLGALGGGDLVPAPMEIGIGAGDNVFLLSSAGVLSPWLVPYGYENRSGIDSSKFEDSPADSDRGRRYSVRVDDGVFLYSVGGQFAAQRLDRMWWQRNSPRFFGGGLLAVALFFAIVMARSSKKSAIAGVAALVVSGGAGLGLHETGHATCYIMSPLFYERDPAIVARQKQLLDKYHRNGVIEEATYTKAVSVLDEGPTTQPSSAPSEDR